MQTICHPDSAVHYSVCRYYCLCKQPHSAPIKLVHITIADNQTKEVDNFAQYFMKCLVYGTAKSSYENIIKYGHLNPLLLSG